MARTRSLWKLLVVDVPGAEGHVDEKSGNIAWLRSGAHSTGVGLVGEGASLTIGENRRVVLRIAASDVVRRFKLYLTKVAAGDEASLGKWIADSKPPEDLQALTAPTDPRWTETIVTQGVRSTEPGPYVVDTLTLPTENPYRALMFTSGHDFFSSGDAAICTAHGEVWVVSGIDDSLRELRWRRFATGLYQPLGLKIVGDVVYVVGRDQITRLVDRNRDGEADWYENFNNDSSTSGGHDFSTCLETDRAGNFYFLHAKDGLVQISPDGRQRRVIASGFRNPNGMGIGPDDTITVAPQEGEWVGASSIIEIKPGGYYGFPGPKVTPTRPLGYDPPWCWIPRALDNSSGGQVWVEGDRFGPLAGHLVHLSYGRSWPLLALGDKVGDVRQGAVTPLSVRFESGAMRGRMRPQDGQLYVTGLRGWENNAVRDGCFERMRYTGAAAHLPLEIKYHEDGVAVTFSCPLDKTSAEDVDNYSIEVWNDAYHKTYGSPDFKVSSPGIEGRDELDVRAATLQADGRTVFLSLDRLSPVMQIGVEFTLDAVDGVADQFGGLWHDSCPASTVARSSHRGSRHRAPKRLAAGHRIPFAAWARFSLPRIPAAVRAGRRRHRCLPACALGGTLRRTRPVADTVAASRTIRFDCRRLFENTAARFAPLSFHRRRPRRALDQWPTSDRRHGGKSLNRGISATTTAQGLKRSANPVHPRGRRPGEFPVALVRRKFCRRANSADGAILRRRCSRTCRGHVAPLWPGAICQPHVLPMSCDSHQAAAGESISRNRIGVPMPELSKERRRWILLARACDPIGSRLGLPIRAESIPRPRCHDSSRRSRRSIGSKSPTSWHICGLLLASNPRLLFRQTRTRR